MITAMSIPSYWFRRRLVWAAPGRPILRVHAEMDRSAGGGFGCWEHDRYTLGCWRLNFGGLEAKGGNAVDGTGGGLNVTGRPSTAGVAGGVTIAGGARQQLTADQLGHNGRESLSYTKRAASGA